MSSLVSDGSRTASGAPGAHGETRSRQLHLQVRFNHREVALAMPDKPLRLHREGGLVDDDESEPVGRDELSGSDLNLDRVPYSSAETSASTFSMSGANPFFDRWP